MLTQGESVEAHALRERGWPVSAIARPLGRDRKTVRAYLLVGALSHSGAWGGVLAESEEQPYLIAALHAGCERLGGVTRKWRFDRMSTVCHPESGDVTASFAAVAKYYGVTVAVCPSRSGWRKGVVEKANHSAARRWWRTLPDEGIPGQAQARLGAWGAPHGDAPRPGPGGQRA